MALAIEDDERNRQFTPVQLVSEWPLLAVSGRSIQAVCAVLNVRYQLERSFGQVECRLSALNLPLS